MPFNLNKEEYDTSLSSNNDFEEKIILIDCIAHITTLD